MTSLSVNLIASKERHPDRVALRCDDLQYTFAEFDAAAARVATLLEHAGIEPGDRVGVMLPNTPAFAIAFYGIIYRGAVAVPMNPLLKAREVAFYLSNSGANALFATPGFADEASAGADEAGAQCWIVDDAGLTDLIADLPGQESPVERGADDVAVILHTSGTTGNTDPQRARRLRCSLVGHAQQRRIHRRHTFKHRDGVPLDHLDCLARLESRDERQHRAGQHRRVEATGQTEYVKQRQAAHHHVVRPDFDESADADLGVAAQIAVGEHGALGLSGSA